MHNKQKQRYLIAIYLLIGLGTVVLGYIGTQTPSPYQSILLNISADLAGVVIIFAIINRFFLIDEWNTSERIQNLLDQLENHDRASAIDFFQPSPDITGHLATAQQIDLCGITLTAVVTEQLANLRDRILEGSDLRLILIDPESAAIEMAALRSEGRDADYYKRRIVGVLHDIQYLASVCEAKSNVADSTKCGSISVRLLPYCPSFSISAFNQLPNTSRATSTVFIEIYPHNSATQPPTFEVTPESDGIWHQFFLDQFESLWAEAKVWQSEHDSAGSAHQSS